MCGIAGIVTKNNVDISLRIERMIKAQSHRGPDGNGKWISKWGDRSIALGHTRLAILDLSYAGKQPIHSACGRHTLIYNGEIYNYKELRQELEADGIIFNSQCDTEIVLQSLIVWGEKSFQKFNGMWALAWLDKENGQLLLSRDRFGVKPLYYYVGKEELYFASEIKTLLQGKDGKVSINYSAAGRYLRQTLLDAQTDTFFSGVQRLMPGHMIRFRLNDGSKNECAEICYWSMPETPVFNGSNGDKSELIEQIRDTFADAVRLRLRSDVPVGVLLSGGIDSSSIASWMNQILGKDSEWHILSAVSDNPDYDEQKYIDIVGRYLDKKIEKIPLHFNLDSIFGLLEEISWVNDEPVGSLSNIAHYLIMKRAKELGITVLLSGQGADELLCGYRKYLGFYIQGLIKEGRYFKAGDVLEKFYRRKTIISQFAFREAKRYLPAFLKIKEINALGPRLQQYDDDLNVGLGKNTLIQRQIEDYRKYSIPALTHYEDRMSMSMSREIRFPFLDYRLVNMILPLAPEYKINDGWTKWIFRKSMEDHLPPEIVWRKDKQGFINPEEEWFKYELQEKIEKIFNGDLLVENYGLINREKIKEKYKRFCKQEANRGTVSFADIFNVVSLEFWMRKYENWLSLS